MEGRVALGVRWVVRRGVRRKRPFLATEPSSGTGFPSLFPMALGPPGVFLPSRLSSPSSCGESAKNRIGLCQNAVPWPKTGCLPARKGAQSSKVPQTAFAERRSRAARVGGASEKGPRSDSPSFCPVEFGCGPNSRSAFFRGAKRPSSAPVNGLFGGGGGRYFHMRNARKSCAECVKT